MHARTAVTVQRRRLTVSCRLFTGVVWDIRLLHARSAVSTEVSMRHHLQIFEYVQLDLKKYMGQDKKKTHLPLKPAELKVRCSAVKPPFLLVQACMHTQLRQDCLFAVLTLVQVTELHVAVAR